MFFGNNLKWKLVLFLLYHDHSHIAWNCFLRYYHFKCVWPGMSKLPKITSLLFLCNILKQTWVMLIFYHAGKHETLLQIDTLILLGREWSSIPIVPKIASLQCLYNISKKKLEMKLIFCRHINIKVSCKVILSLLLGMTKQALSKYSK